MLNDMLFVVLGNYQKERHQPAKLRVGSHVADTLEIGLRPHKSPAMILQLWGSLSAGVFAPGTISEHGSLEPDDSRALCLWYPGLGN